MRYNIYFSTLILLLCSFLIQAQTIDKAGVTTPVSVNAGADIVLTFPASTTTIHGSASGGQAPYYYSWTKTKGFSPTMNSTASVLQLSNLVVGKYTFKLKVYCGNGTSASDEVNVTVLPGANIIQSPFGGTPKVIPGKIEAEEYDFGGQNVSYVDLTIGNSDGVFRNDNVDIVPTTDEGGGYTISSIGAGEWLEYTVNVNATGIYNFDVRVASPKRDQKLHIEIDGVNVTGLINVPYTGGWQNWRTVKTGNISLKQGRNRILRIYMDTDGYNLNYLNVTQVMIPPPVVTTLHAPYGGEPKIIPGKIEAEEYDEGGQNKGYSDNTEVNTGGSAFRNDNVDIYTTTDPGGGYTIGWVYPGEWLEYTVNVTATGVYNFEYRVSSVSSGKTFHVELDGVNITGSVKVPNTGDWEEYQTVTTSNISLTQGIKKLRIFMETDGFNLNYVNVVKGSNVRLRTKPDNSLSSVIIYPNPTKGMVVIKKEIEGKSDVSVSIANIIGNEVYSKSFEDVSGVFEEQMDLLEYPSGIYILSLKINDKVWVKKIIRE